MDAIELLLQDKQHLTAQKLLAFHRKNRTFLARFVAELRLLQTSGQRAGSAESIFHYLRWVEDWQGVDEFEVNQNLAPLAGRVCSLLWRDVNGMMKFIKCEADEILGTRIVKRRGRYGTFLYPGKTTLLPTIAPPDVPAITRPRTVHELITTADAAKIIPGFEGLVQDSPKPKGRILQAWLRHVKEQPELYALMERTLLQRRPPVFSAFSLLEYARWSIKRAVESDKRFTVCPSEGLYCRALIMRNEQFNGLCKFKKDGQGKLRRGRLNRLLGCTLAQDRIPGEPYRRLVWTKAAHD